MRYLNIIDTKLEGVKIIRRKPIIDTRGSFSRLFCSDELSKIGWDSPIMQINHSYTSKKGSIRGFHLQTFPHLDMKIVTCVKGKIFDVVIDLRAGSKTFLSWHSEILSSNNGSGLLIPKGFAHGFQALTNNVELIYCHSAKYSPASDIGFNPINQSLGFSWPMAVGEVSIRDLSNPKLDADFQGIFV